jgi:hypothetical protein
MNSITKPEFLVEQQSTRKDIRVFRDEQIRTTWKVSFKVGRFYKKADDLYATQDIKFDETLSENEVLSQLYEKATKYRNRIIKAGGFNSPSTCMPGFNRFYSL